MSEYQKIRRCGAEIIQSGREFSTKRLWQFIAAFVIAANSCPGFAQSGVADMGAELLNQSPTARRLKDKYNSVVETVEEKKQRIKERIECSMDKVPLGCTTVFGGKAELTDEQIKALSPQGQELYWQRIGDPKESALSKAKERIREFAGTGSDSPDSKGAPSSDQSSRPTPGFDAAPGVNLPEGARQACGARRACSDVFKLAAVANGLTNQEPATFAQAERFCNAALIRAETVDAANSCTHFYKSRFDNGQPKQSPDGADNPSSGSSTLEAMMDGQKAQDASEAAQARRAAARRDQEWEWASAQQRQLQVQEAERQRAQQAQMEAQRANANSDAAAAAIFMGITGAAAASSSRAPAAAARSAAAPSAGTPRSAATPYVVVPRGRSGPTGVSSGGSQSRSSSVNSRCAGVNSTVTGRCGIQ